MNVARHLRTLIALSRPVRLPTVWSNCLAGWWLGGAGRHDSLPFVIAGATLLYLGLAFLNDALDVGLDRQQQRQRPIPAGAVSLRLVWRSALGLLVIGTLCLFWAGTTPGALGLAIVFFGILFNSLNRFVSFAPILIGLCRLLLYLLGASVANHGITGWALWCGLALGIYATGQACLQRCSVNRQRIERWAAALLAVPVLLALLMNSGSYREPALLLSAALVLWTLRALRHSFWTLEKNPERTASLVLAGTVLVDWLACCNAPRELSFIFLALLLVGAVFQQVPGVK